MPRTSAPSVVLFGRDLRTQDHPALTKASERGPVLALFVIDDVLVRSAAIGPNRLAFLLESLVSLRDLCRSRGTELYVRRGDPASVAARAATTHGNGTVVCSDDASPRFRRRVAALRELLGPDAVELCHGPTVIRQGEVRTARGSSYRVFTPYYRAWVAAPRRAVLPEADISGGVDAAPGRIPTPEELASGDDPIDRRRFAPRVMEAASPGRERGGRDAAERALASFLTRLPSYAEDANNLGTPVTSRLSAHLHFGTLSAREVEVAVASHGESSEAVIRQLCWRDFYHELYVSAPHLATKDLRPRPGAWRVDADELAAWAEGRTGIDIVDAAMRQLRREGFMHNRARLIASSYLTKTLRHDWREGARHFAYWLTDADVASNAGNWQWMAGTGTDTRPNRILSPVRQAARFDPTGAYRARYLGRGTEDGGLSTT